MGKSNASATGTKPRKKREVEVPKPEFKDIAFKADAYFSTNYSQFKFGQNRKIKKAHLENLKASMNERGFIPQFRVLVTKDGFIIDGQHRLMAAMETRKGYYYEICDLSTSLIAMLNNLQLKWKGIDFVEYYAHARKTHYVELLKVINDYNAFPYAAIMALLRSKGGMKVTQNISSGKFTFDNRPDVIRKLNYLSSFSEHIEIYKSSKIVRAFDQFHRNCKGYNHAKMFDAVRKHRAKFIAGNETVFYLQIFKEIYK